MEIFAFAMQMEEDGERYYRELAERAPTRVMSQIFALLAQEEVKHYRLVQSLRDEEEGELDEGTFREDIKNLFEELGRHGEDYQTAVPQVELYRKAQELELQSQRFYEERAREANPPAVKRLLVRLAIEEEAHYDMLGSVIDFLSQPLNGDWMEKATWYTS